jgi:RND family efflux transporter MFP subunit
MNALAKSLAVVVLLGGGVFAYTQLRRTDVVVTPVVRGRAVDAVYATGTVEADDRVVVKARLSGSVAECLVREGDAVKKGDLLARLDNPGVTFALTRGRTQLAAASKQAGAQSPQLAGLASQAASIRAEIDLVRAEVERAKSLAASGSASSVDLDKLQTRLAQLESQLRANAAQQQALGIDLDANAAQLAESVKALASQVTDTEVRSPLDGVVLRKTTSSGEVVAVGQTLFEIGDTSKLVLKIAIDEADVATVSADPPSSAVASLYAFAGRAFTGKVTRIFPDADRATKSFVAYVKLDAPPVGLRSGMSSEVNIVVAQKDDVLIAPMEAIDGGFAWVVSSGVAHRRPVTLGIHDLLRAEVERGLGEGDLVVVDGQGALSDGARVATRSTATALPPAVDRASAKR